MGYNNILIPICLFLSILLSFIKKITSKKVSSSPKLPPGSMGWPFLGETLQLYSQDPNLFFSTRQSRYGEIFKTHILGCPCVMLASPEAARFVLVANAHLFKPTYPKSKERLIGGSALFFHQGDYHFHLRKLVQSSLLPDSIKEYIPHIESIAISSLYSWSHDDDGHVINTFHEIKKISFQVGILSIFGLLDSNYIEKLNENYHIVEKGYNSFPTNIPGTAYHKALLARRRLRQILSEIICERKEKRLVEKDVLSRFLNYRDQNGNILKEDQIADNIIGVLFAAQDTTASVLTWILKFLHDDQNLLESVKAEQMAIYEANKAEKKSLSWGQTRNMPLTYRVILESLRMASIISFAFREAIIDVEYKGFLIPKGWKVMPLFRNIHHNPNIFSDPHIFDPSRFEVAPKPNTFIPFGNGVHACPGNELAKLEILIFIHHLVTKFRWKVEGPVNGIEYGPFPVPEGGLPARFWKEEST
ncbi:abscisic acid 8'-hydroxylase 4-like [Euphorbia lathyris]|uniref:abscisic acid 8'-hydroxylase 4-like n=1 Tax=Euphorbia lathyris TaxID=212925 RepID=UPI003314230B